MSHFHYQLRTRKIIIRMYTKTLKSVALLSDGVFS